MKIINIISKLPKHPTAKYKSRPPEKVKEIIIHHSATRKGTPFAFANYHINTRDFPGIGYHYVINKQGEIFQCNEIGKITWHCSGRNTESVGICLIGHFDEEKPTIEQMQSLQELISFLKERISFEKISGHRDYSSKTCPGEFLPARVYEKMFEGGTVAPPENLQPPKPVEIIIPPTKIEREKPKEKNLPLLLKLIFAFLDLFGNRKKKPSN